MYFHYRPGSKESLYAVYVYFFLYRPSSKENLLRLEDFPQAKVEKFGPMFVKILTDYCHQNEAKMDEFPEIKLQKVIKTVNLVYLVGSYI